jgi:ATP-dependent protease ClpP protease subunit
MRTILDDLNNFSVDYKNREIFIHRYFNNSEEDDVENKMSSMFIKNIRALDQKVAPILIHLNAGGGGEWEQGMSMYDAITFSESYITVLIYGYACSMSSIIPQAADFRVMMPNSYMMCHYGSETIDGNHSNNIKYFELCKKLSKKMVDIYASKIQYSPFVKEKKAKNPLKYAETFIRKKMEGDDWYLTAEDALYYGLVDKILGSNEYPNIRSLKHA